MLRIEEAHYLILGRVQGVGYRFATLKKAMELNLTGWVKNCEDGSVEVLAEGTKKNLDSLISWLRVGPPSASVREIKIIGRQEILTTQFKSFEITR